MSTETKIAREHSTPMPRRSESGAYTCEWTLRGQKRRSSEQWEERT